MNDVRWKERPWTGPADSLESDIVYSEDGTVPLKITTCGLCPVCEHGFTSSAWLLVDVAGFLPAGDDDEAALKTIELRLRSLAEQGGAPPAVGEVSQEIVCSCGEEHVGRPEGSSGCGAYWTWIVDLTDE